jgi:hypothetical protein
MPNPEFGNNAGLEQNKEALRNGLENSLEKMRSTSYLENEAVAKKHTLEGLLEATE